MGLWVIVGSVCLGVCIGWLVRYVFYRVRKFSAKTISTTIGAILGGPVIGVLSKQSEAVWCYFVGLLVGGILYSIVGYFAMKAGVPPGVLYKEEQLKKPAQTEDDTASKKG